MDVAAGKVGRLLRLPRRHPQLIHPTIGLLRLTWTRLRLRSMSLRSPINHQGYIHTNWTKGAFTIFNLLPSCSFKLISNVLALSYCRGWIHAGGVRKPNQLLGTLCRHHFPGWVMLPGEGELPQLALTWELYKAAPAPLGEMVDGVVCETMADIVRQQFWTISPLQN